MVGGVGGIFTGLVGGGDVGLWTGDFGWFLGLGRCDGIF